MCGLTFLYESELSETECAQRTAQALKCQAHRGPDEEGMLARPGWALGHRRLSIIDLSASRQPMGDPSGRYHLAYNGEVYNYAELRERLDGRWSFRTAGDTEVVLAGLVLHGASFLELMEGMWGLALWDSQGRRLLLARDRMGKKPLFYIQGRNRFACASELPSLACLSETPFQEDLDSTADYLRYGYYLPGTTAYSGVHEVLPGHWLSWSPNAGTREQPYWSLSIGGFQGTVSQARETLREKLAQAVRRRLVADVEVGAFLSGGIDSSLVVALHRKQAGVPPKTFTIGFPETSFDERRYARIVSERFGTDHFEEVLDGWDPDRLTNLVLSHVGQPFADSSILPTALVSELAARHVKVALSGDGGDELFSGYQRYQARTVLRWYTRLPRALRQPAERLMRLMPEPVAHHSRSLLKKMHLFLDTVRRLDAETPYVAPVMYAKEDFQVLAPDLVGRGHAPPGLPEFCDSDDILRMMAADALVYLPQDILVKVDRASMAHSLEARAPFLDREVVEFALSLPRPWHRRGFSGKRMLRETFSDLLPTDIWSRRKQGFGVPVGQWFRGNLGAELVQRVAESRAPVRQTELMRFIEEHRQGKRDHGNRLWQLHVYLIWASRSTAQELR